MEHQIDQILARHFAGEATSADEEFLRKWVRSNKANKEEFNRLGLAYQLAATTSDNARQNAVYSRLSKRITTKKSINIQTTLRPIYTYWRAIAAVLVLLVSAIAVVHFTDKANTPEIQTAQNLITKSNPAGQKLKVFLPDGSIVWLNSRSELSYLPNFTDSSRDLRLAGEAYFEVIKDSTRPFVVHTGDVATTALGTAFNIEAFNPDNIIVSLTQGSVNVQSHDSNGGSFSVKLNPGEGAWYNSNDGGQLQKIAVDIAKVRSWKDGILTLSDATIDQTVEVLERWYGVEIIVQNPGAKQWKVNGVFDNEYLDNVLNSLSFSQGFDYAINGNNVQLTIK